VSFANVTVTNSTGAAKVPRPSPRVYFLFLAVDKISNLGVWTAFFKSAPQEQFRAFVHCKLPACNAQVQGTELIPVPTVPSYYCTDLVSPMNQLLNLALRSDITYHANDKFAFISDSTLPAKPFSSMYATLSGRQGSDFCVFPSFEWADTVGTDGKLEVAPKHHQWITLERAHAEKLLQEWWSGKLHNLMAHFRMNQDAYQTFNNSYGDHRNFGCLDEFWHMAALYGPISQVDMNAGRNLPLPSFINSPLWISSTSGWQGECDTFVMWAKHLNYGTRNPFLKFYQALDPPSIPHGGNFARPGWWDKISTHGLKVIRDSSFMFMRKFIDNPALTDGPDFAAAYEQLVFS
jgi:hypothetical protein